MDECKPLVEGRDVLVQAPTGSGKTLAYLLPLAHILAQLDAGARDADAVAAAGPARCHLPCHKMPYLQKRRFQRVSMMWQAK